MPDQELLPPPPKKKQSVSGDGLLPPPPKKKIQDGVGTGLKTGGTVGSSVPQSENATNPFAIGGKYNKQQQYDSDKLDLLDTKHPKVEVSKMPLTQIVDNATIQKPLSEIDIREAKEKYKQHKIDMETAIDNTTEKLLKNKGIVAAKGSAIYQEQRKKIEEKTKPTMIGGIVINGAEATYHKDKNGNIGLDRNLGFLEGIRTGFNNAVNAEDEADAFSEMTTEEKVEYANKQMEEKPTEYMQERGGVGELLGGAAPYLVKATAAATLATAATIVAPETAGASLVGIAPVLTVLLTAPDMIKQGAKDEIMTRYMQLKEERPDINDVELMKIAEHGEISGGLLGAANAVAFTTTLKLPILDGSKSVLKSYLNGVASSAVHLGGITAGTKAAQLAERKIEGYNVDTDKAIKEITTTFADNATAGAILNGLISGAHILPKVVKSAFKFSLKDTPVSEIQTTLKANEEAGRIPEGTADQVVADINGYKEALEKINTKGLSEDSQASIAGLIQAKDNLKKEAETKDESVRQPYEEKIQAINQQISDIQRTNKPLEHEVDDVTGNTIEKPSFDDVAKRRVEDVADKISKGKQIEDVIDVQTQAKFPDQLEKQLNKILREEKSNNKDKENPNTEISDNINKFLEQNKKIEGEPENISKPIELSTEPTTKSLVDDGSSNSVGEEKINTIADKIIAKKEKLTDEELKFVDDNKKEVDIAVGKKVMANNKAKTTVKPTTENKVEDNSPQGLLNKYNEDTKYNIYDLVNDIEKVSNETGDTNLKDAVAKYREEQAYDNETSGRNDMTAAEDNFVKAVEQSLSPKGKEVEPTSSVGKIIDTGNGRMYGSYGNEAMVADKKVKFPKPGFYIADVSLNEGVEKGKGAGQEIYIKALKENGRLYSTSEVFPVTEDAMRVQKSLEKKGLVTIREEKIDGVYFRVIEPTEKLLNENKANEITNTEKKSSNTVPTDGEATPVAAKVKEGGKGEPPTGEPTEPVGEGKGTKELDSITNNIPVTGKVAEYMSKDSIITHTGEKPQNDQTRDVQELNIALEHSEKVIEKVKELYGDNYVEKTLDYIEQSAAAPSNKALVYVALENALGKEKLLHPEKSAEITKLQSLVYSHSQKYGRELGLGLGYFRLRAFAKAGYDINKVTDNFFSEKELVEKKEIENAIEADADTVQKEYESQKTGGMTPVIEKAIKEGVEKEIAKLYEALPKEKKTAVDKAIAALDKVHEKLRGKAYESTLGIPLAIIDMGVVTIRAALKAGVKAVKAIEMGIDRIKEKYGKEWANENQFRKDYLDGLKEHGVLDAQQRRQAEKEYQMLETERNRQLEKVADLTEKLKTLQSGKRLETNPKEAKPDVPEIEALKQKVKDETKKLNALDAQQRRIDTLETELDRLQNRLPKEKSESVKRQLSEREAELKEQINSEKESIRKENKENNNLRLSNAKDAVRQRIEKIKTEIATKERELKEKNKPLNEDLELQRLKEIEKSITELRDKYLPEEKDPYELEKQRERVKDKLVSDIITLNEQINIGERNKKPEKQDLSQDAELNKLRKIKSDKVAILNEIAPLAKPKEKTTAEKVVDAENNLQKKIDAIRDEIATGERDLAKSKDKLQSKKLEQLRQQKKSLEALRDKYLPKGKDPYANEKAAKAVEDKLVKENIELNRQIQKGEKDKSENKVTLESENIDKLKAERDGRKEILEAIDPTPKIYVENALIEQGFGKEVNVKGEKKEILDWKKLAGTAGTTGKISENVGKALEKSGFTETQLERIKDKFIQEYIDLRYSVIEKSQNELARRNKENVTAGQKSAAKKLAELYTYGLFEQNAAEFEVAINKALGAKVSEAGFNEAKKIAQAMETIYSSSFNDVKLTDVSAKAALQKLEDRLRILLSNESKGQGNGNLRMANIVRNYFELQQTMILNNLKQATENPFSGLSQNVIDKINAVISGENTKELSAQRSKIMRTVYKDILLNKGIGYGKTESTFVNRQHIDDYVNKLSDNKVYHGIMSVATGKATLNGMDAMFKAAITEKKFAGNLINILTHETNPNRMSKDDAVKFVSEKLTGQTFKDAQATAEQIITKINKEAGEELIPNNETSRDRFANDIVKAALEMGNKITPEQVNAAYNAAYKSAGLNLGHEPNNPLSGMLKTYGAKLEGDLNQAIKNKEWNRAAFLTYKSVLFRNIANPFVGGGTNWLVIKLEKTGLGLVTGLVYQKGSKGKIDVGTELGMKRLEERLYNQSRYKDSYMRGLVGGMVSTLGYAAFVGIAGTDEYRKWRGEHRWTARYLDVITPEYLLAEMAAKDKKIERYVATSFNKNDAFDASTKLVKAGGYFIKGDNAKGWGAVGEAIGSKFNAPIPWRLVKDGQVIYQGVTGQDPYHGNYKPSEGFLSGVLQGGAIEWLGGRPISEPSTKPQKQTKKEKKEKSTKN